MIYIQHINHENKYTGLFANITTMYLLAMMLDLLDQNAIVNAFVLNVRMSPYVEKMESHTFHHALQDASSKINRLVNSLKLARK